LRATVQGEAFNKVICKEELVIVVAGKTLYLTPNCHCYLIPI